MPVGGVDDSQRKAARIVGFAYLGALLPAVFAEFLSEAGSSPPTMRFRQR
jgi:hypothetical protein